MAPPTANRVQCMSGILLSIPIVSCGSFHRSVTCDRCVSIMHKPKSSSYFWRACTFASSGSLSQPYAQKRLACIPDRLISRIMNVFLTISASPFMRFTHVSALPTPNLLPEVPGALAAL